VGERGGALGAEIVEEPTQGLLRAVLPSPHQPAGVMAGHHQQIPLPLTAVMWVILVKGFRKDFLMNFCRVVDAQGDLAL
jgi:hypothetical protein